MVIVNTLEYTSNSQKLCLQYWVVHLPIDGKNTFSLKNLPCKSNICTLLNLLQNWSDQSKFYIFEQLSKNSQSQPWPNTTRRGQGPESIGPGSYKHGPRHMRPFIRRSRDLRAFRDSSTISFKWGSFVKHEIWTIRLMWIRDAWNTFWAFLNVLELSGITMLVFF